MSSTRVVFFKDEGGCPGLDQLSKKIQAKAQVRIERLAEMGHELRRPEADYHRDNIMN